MLCVFIEPFMSAGVDGRRLHLIRFDFVYIDEGFHVSFFRLLCLLQDSSVCSGIDRQTFEGFPAYNAIVICFECRA